MFITFGIFCSVLALILLWQAHSAMFFLLAAIAEGGGNGTLISMMITMMADRSQPQERGKVFAICITGLDLGIAIAAPLLSTIAAQLGYRDMFGYTAEITSPDPYSLKKLKVRSDEL